MTPEQYEQFLVDLARLRRALDLSDGALPISPRSAFLECIEEVERWRSERRREDEL